MSAKLLATPTNVSVTYSGSKTLTISPALDGVTHIQTDSTFNLAKTLVPYTFSVTNRQIASVWNHADMDLVEIFGGTTVSGTSTLDITVDFST
ncbi:hypothetical protein B0H17DRAFT_1210355 [Mycena rosella]|uniref:Uncharacterized protein n=1 Tax=Mycena rosella TaxID=1033263 RepID=A0AAD7CWW5_MYCRO|nr:hypothetical protein B0H17DRAFT_1210355 [Mycena rosella]